MLYEVITQYLGADQGPDPGQPLLPEPVGGGLGGTEDLLGGDGQAHGLQALAQTRQALGGGVGDKQVGSYNFV